MDKLTLHDGMVIDCNLLSGSCFGIMYGFEEQSRN